MAQVVPDTCIEAPATLPFALGNRSAAPQTCATRVLHVINGEHYSGAERVQDLLAQELPQLGFDVGFACVKSDLFPSARKTQSAPLYEAPMRWACDPHCVLQLVEIIRSEGYVLVHAHTPRSLLMGSLAARRAKVPLVYHVHSPAARDSTRKMQNYFNAKLERWALRHADRVVSVSPSLKQWMCKQGCDEDKLVYVPNGVPPIDVKPRLRRVGTWTLGIMALFRPRKGTEVLIEALASLRSQGVDVNLRAVGAFETPEYQSEIMDLAERLNVAEAITWTGFVEDVAAELTKMDLFVLPSLFGEGLPMVVLEAMAAAVPVIASHVEGIPEAIRHREDGLLFEPGSVSQLVLAIEQVITHHDGLDYEAMSRNAQQRHSEHFSARAMATELASVYREVLD